MKRLLALTALFLVALATPALAWTHMIEVAGVGDCSDGQVVITWTVTNTVDGNVQLTDSSRPTVVEPKAIFGGNMSVYFKEYLPGDTTAPQTLTLSWLDANEATQSSSATVELQGVCPTPTPTTPPPTSPPPTSPPPDPTPPPTHHTPSTFTPPARLANTGVNPTVPVVAIAGLLLAGMSLLWATRKRSV